MFVSVEMRYDYTGSLQFSDLRRRFGFNIVHIDSAPEQAQSESIQGFVKAAIVELSIRQSRGCRFFLKERPAVHQYHVATDAQPRRRCGALDRVIEGPTVRHKSRGGYDAVGMGFHNGSVHTLSEPEIIRIDDQTPHAPV
jgi:hypothetical protein